MAVWSCVINNSEEIKTSDYEHFLYCIASHVLGRIKYHLLDNYYIYKDGKLFNIIKGSEFDPLSKYKDEWSEAQKDYLFDIEINNTFQDIEDKFDFIYQIIQGEHHWSESELEQIKEIYKKVKDYDEDIDEFD